MLAIAGLRLSNLHPDVMCESFRQRRFFCVVQERHIIFKTQIPPGNFTVHATQQPKSGVIFHLNFW